MLEPVLYSLVAGCQGHLSIFETGHETKSGVAKVLYGLGELHGFKARSGPCGPFQEAQDRLVNCAQDFVVLHRVLSPSKG